MQIFLGMSLTVAANWGKTMKTKNMLVISTVTNKKSHNFVISFANNKILAKLAKTQQSIDSKDLDQDLKIII